MNKFAVVALSLIALLFVTAIPIFKQNRHNVSRKPGTLANQQTKATYSLSDAVKERIKGSVVLYIGSPVALIKGTPGDINANNLQAVPIIKNNEAYVPATFIAGALGAQANRDANTGVMTIKFGCNTISLVNGQNKISVNGVQKFLPSPTFSQYGETYIPLPLICEILGSNYDYCSNVIIVSPRGKSMDLNKEKNLLYDLIYYFNSGKASAGLNFSKEANSRVGLEVSDIGNSSSYARDAIISLASKNIISGDEKGNFNPTKGVTRPQMIKILVNALGIDISNIPGTSTFKDVPKSHWAYPYVEAGYREGLIKGVSAENFGINYYCTREQIAAMLTRALGATDDILSDSSTADSLVQFFDRNDISSWAQKSVAFAAVNNIMKGSGDGKFIPKSTATREQMALVIYRFLKNEKAISKKISQLMKNRKIRVYLNEDELNLYAFPVTENDPNASTHDHSLIFQNNVIMAPVVLLRFLDIDIFENIKPNSISLLEAAPFGTYTSLIMKPNTDHAYLNLQGENPYLDEDKYKDNLIVLPTAPRLINNHLYVPIAEISRLFGAKTIWDKRSYSVKIKNMGSPRFPNLYWAPRIIQKMKADYDLKMAVSFVDTAGKEFARMDYTSAGYLNSDEYSGRASVKTSADLSSSYNTESEYEVKRYLNRTSGYKYSVKNLKGQTYTKGSVNSIRNGEILLTDVEYIRKKIELLSQNFYASELLKKQSDIKINNQLVDKYTVVLNDMPSIVELFDIKRLPAIDILKPIYERDSYIPDAEAYVFESFKMELYVNKSRQVINSSIYYSGYKRNERPITQGDIEEFQRTGKWSNKYNIPFEVFIEVDFSGFKH